MAHIRKHFVRSLCLATISIPSMAFASQGTLTVGTSANSQAMGGATVAAPQDAVAASVNPAGMAYVGNRWDLDLQVVIADSTVDVGSPLNRQKGDIIAPIPQFGFNYQVSPNVTIGLSTLGSGVGFNFDNPVAPGIRRTKGMLQQVDVMPTITYKFDNGLAFGLSAVGALQLFKVQGFPGPFPDGQFPAHGRKAAVGASVRAGVIWPVTPWATVGASYFPKMKMSKVKGYRDDLLAPTGGSIDSPERFEAGIALKPTERLTFAADYQFINWEDVRTLRDAFGWRNQHVLKLGVRYQADDDWTFRAGFNHSRRHITSEEAFQNFLLIGINPTAATFGASRRLGERGELKLVVERDFGGALVGTGASEGSRIKTNFSSVSVGYGMRF